MVENEKARGVLALMQAAQNVGNIVSTALGTSSPKRVVFAAVTSAERRW